jgi:hypothetical protein
MFFSYDHHLVLHVQGSSVQGLIELLNKRWTPQNTSIPAHQNTLFYSLGCVAIIAFTLNLLAIFIMLIT